MSRILYQLGGEQSPLRQGSAAHRSHAESSYCHLQGMLDYNQL
jgi:hypothetical protein